MPAIQTFGLEKTYTVGFWRKRPRCALHALNLAVEEGEVFGYLGPNGAGKTTTLKLLMGLVYPTAGSAKYLGEGTSRGEQRRNPLLPLTFSSSPLWRGRPRPRCFDCSSVGHGPLTRGHRRPRLCWRAKLASDPDVVARAPPPAIPRREAIDSPYSVPLVTSFHISPCI